VKALAWLLLLWPGSMLLEEAQTFQTGTDPVNLWRVFCLLFSVWLVYRSTITEGMALTQALFFFIVLINAMQEG